MVEFSFFNLFVIASQLLVFFTLMHMLYQRRTPQSLTVWLLVLFLLPFVGVFLYVLVGSRKIISDEHRLTIKPHSTHEMPPEHKLECLLRQNNIAGVTDSNSFELIWDGTEAYGEIIHALSNAKKVSIFLPMFIPMM